MCAIDRWGDAMSRASNRGCGSGARLGAAVAELAICLPLLVLLVFASIEACSMIFLDHGLSIASYEGVRAAINYDGTNADVTARCNEIISQREIADATVSTNPGDVSNPASNRDAPLSNSG